MWCWVLNHWLTQEKFWVAFGSLMTAGALIYTLFFKAWLENRRGIINLKKSLVIELKTNVVSIFSQSVDRPLLFDAIKKLRESYIDKVKDEGHLGQIQKLYLDLQFYSRFVDNYYLKGLEGKYITEQQLIVCNDFLHYFGCQVVEYVPDKVHLSNGDGYVEGARNAAVTTFGEEGDDWMCRIENNIDELL